MRDERLKMSILAGCVSTLPDIVYFLVRCCACVSVTHTSSFSLCLRTETIKQEEFHKVALSYSFGLLLNGCAISASGSGPKMALDGAAQVCVVNECMCVCACVFISVHACPCLCICVQVCPYVSMCVHVRVCPFDLALPEQRVSVSCLCLCMCLFLCLRLSLSLSLRLFRCLCPSFSLCLSLFLSCFVCLFLSVVLSLSLSLSLSLCLIFVTLSEISCRHLLCALLCSLTLSVTPATPPLSPSSLLHGLVPLLPSTLGIGHGAQILTFEKPVEFNGIFLQKSADTNHSSDFDPVSFSGFYFVYV